MKRRLPFGYVSMQGLFFGAPWLWFYLDSLNPWWALGPVTLYLAFQLNAWQWMRKGVPKSIKSEELPWFFRPPKGAQVTPREAFLRLELIFSAKAYALAASFFLFGALMAFFTRDLVFAAGISTVALFGVWQSLKTMNFYSSVEGRFPHHADGLARFFGLTFLYSEIILDIFISISERMEYSTGS